MQARVEMGGHVHVKDAVEVDRLGGVIFFVRLRCVVSDPKELVSDTSENSDS